MDCGPGTLQASPRPQQRELGALLPAETARIPPSPNVCSLYLPPIPPPNLLLSACASEPVPRALSSPGFQQSNKQTAR